MATPYSKVIEVFLNKITDMDLPKFDDITRDIVIIGYMKSACTKFVKVCEMDLYDRDDDIREFRCDLDDEVIDIITENMLVEWLKPKVLFSDNLSNILNTKDFSMYSPANMLKELRETLAYLKKNARALVNNYSFTHSEVNKNGS
jgi:hypothetical protein